MHICFVEHGYPHLHGGGGGAGTYVQLTGRELVRRGYTVSVLAAQCAQCPEVQDDQGVTIYRLGKTSSAHYYLGKLPILESGALALRFLELSWDVYRLMRKLNLDKPIDLVEFSEGVGYWHALFRTFPFIVHLHGSRFTFLKQSGRLVGVADWWQRKLELAVIRRAQYIFSPSKALLEIVSKEAGGIQVPSMVIPYPLDPRLLNELKLPEKVRQRKVKRIMFASRNDFVKGAVSLLRAIPDINSVVTNTEFHFFGFQPQDSDEMPCNVIVHPFVHKNELLNWYHNVDLCVIPSLWDNSPNTVYEAMAAGKAVVASRVGGIPELVKHGETGVLCVPGDSTSLATAIIELLTNDSRRLSMGLKARVSIQEIAGFESNMNKRLAIYKDLCSSRTEVS